MRRWFYFHIETWQKKKKERKLVSPSEQIDYLFQNQKCIKEKPEEDKKRIIRFKNTYPWRFQKSLRRIKSRIKKLSQIFLNKIACCSLFLCFLGETFSAKSARCLFISLREPPDHIATDMSCNILRSAEITEKSEPNFKKFRKSSALLNQTFKLYCLRATNPHSQKSKIGWAAKVL